GSEEKLNGSLDGLGIRPQLTDRQAPGEICYVNVRSLDLNIKRQLHVHRARATSHHRVPGAMHHEGYLVGPDHIEGALGHWRHDMRKIGRREAVQLLHDPVATHVSGGAAGDE